MLPPPRRKEEKLSSGRGASSPLTARWQMGRSTGGVLRGFAQLESQQREMKCYSKPMVTIMDGVEAEVERVKNKLRKRAQEEVTPIPAI